MDRLSDKEESTISMWMPSCPLIPIPYVWVQLGNKKALKKDAQSDAGGGTRYIIEWFESLSNKIKRIIPNGMIRFMAYNPAINTIHKSYLDGFNLYQSLLVLFSRRIQREYFSSYRSRTTSNLSPSWITLGNHFINPYPALPNSAIWMLPL